MPTVVTKKKGTIVNVVHDPGNMTRYRVVACESGNGLWLVAVLGFGGVLEVLEGLELHYGYLQEKMRIKSDIDGSEIAKAIAMAVPKATAMVCTDDKGKRAKVHEWSPN